MELSLRVEAAARAHEPPDRFCMQQLGADWHREQLAWRIKRVHDLGRFDAHLQLGNAQLVEISWRLVRRVALARSMHHVTRLERRRARDAGAPRDLLLTMSDDLARKNAALSRAFSQLDAHLDHLAGRVMPHVRAARRMGERLQ
jgi:hypothetical protein